MMTHPETIPNVQEDRAEKLYPGLHLIFPPSVQEIFPVDCGLVLRTHLDKGRMYVAVALDRSLEVVTVSLFRHELVRAS